MRKLFEFLRDGCWHDWRLVKQGRIIRTIAWEIEIHTADYWDYQCKKCQAVKEVRK